MPRSFALRAFTSYKSVRVAVPSRIRKKTLRVGRSVAVGYVGVR